MSSDESIITLYFDRDRRAIEETDKKYGKRLYSVSYNIVCDKGDAEECRNSAYFKAWNSIPPHEPRQYLFPFLARIIRRLSLNVCKERNTQKRSVTYVQLSEELENCIPSPDDTESKLDDMAIRDAINGFLSSLSENNRRLFMRRYFYGDSTAAISAGTGMSESAVKTALFRCRQKLLSYLQNEGIYL